VDLPVGGSQNPFDEVMLALLRKAWLKWLREQEKRLQAGTRGLVETVAMDRSVPNLSSIMLLALTRGLACDLGPDNICVNIVTPGLVWTGDEDPPVDWGEPHAGRTALGRNPTAKDVAGAVTFLASHWRMPLPGFIFLFAVGWYCKLGNILLKNGDRLT
jgi:NAD(P)-dependent dehydrogenase (short-subunit alcohol dehydrogenase family)